MRQKLHEKKESRGAINYKKKHFLGQGIKVLIFMGQFSIFLTNNKVRRKIVALSDQLQ